MRWCERKFSKSLVKRRRNMVKDEFDRVKQAENKMRRLEIALATSAAIWAELEKKKQRKLEERKDGLEVKEQLRYVPRQSCAVQGIGFVSNGHGLGDSNWSPFTRESWDNNMGISGDLIAAQAVSSLHIIRKQ
ncbi:hypothetical protein Bca52824_012481 [Brassica carinata]|uniref:Uncharacterized protein n=1 Tax=Brassica carinata TaxID=52824 RepID=A0A8X8B2E9_BRACI|nr:hypothetical protein Bca52824_012481 [Brassica carinata]